MEPYGVEVEVRSERGEYTHTVTRREGDNWPKFFQRVVSAIMCARDCELARSSEMVEGAPGIREPLGYVHHEIHSGTIDDGVVIIAESHGVFVVKPTRYDSDGGNHINAVFGAPMNTTEFIGRDSTARLLMGELQWEFEVVGDGHHRIRLTQIKPRAVLYSRLID